MDMNGKPLLRHTLEAFLTIEGLQSITIVIHHDHEMLCRKCISRLENCRIVYGSNDRKSSVYNGIKELSELPDDEILLIHDAARPFVAEADIGTLLDALDHHDAASLAYPVSDTLRKEKAGIFDTVIDREGLWAMQTPQAFRYGLIKKAHEATESTQVYTDDTSLVSAMGIEVAIIEGGRQNFKITTASDIEFAKKIMKTPSSTEIRTGTGFDVHAFSESATPFMLCGVEIEFEKNLAGHSDADVGLHALTDALLGAIGAGDIGEHFPPSEEKWKGKDSAHFLQKAVDLVHAAKGRIHNLDITLICQEPKIGPYKSRMKTRIAQICALEESRINIKATTTENLGFTGRGEGIAAQAVATVSIAAGENNV